MRRIGNLGESLAHSARGDVHRASDHLLSPPEKVVADAVTTSPFADEGRRRGQRQGAQFTLYLINIANMILRLSRTTTDLLPRRRRA
jgi:hypothetical protein